MARGAAGAGEQTPGVVIVDATAYLFRSFHAIRDLRSRDGQPTNAVYGVANALALLREREQDSAIACVMDAPGKTFRHELASDYKATRKETEPDLIAQIEPAKQLISSLGMALYCVAGVEADDVIATLAKQAIAAGRECLVATSDKDLMVLASKGCRIFDPMKNAELDEDAVAKKYGVPARLMPDYLALVGDSSDNIAGVAGVGPKTAAKWLAEHGDLDRVIAAADGIKGKVGENLRAGFEQLELARKLVALKDNVELEDKPALDAPPQPDIEALDEICTRLRFSDGLRERLGRSEKREVPQQIEVELVTDSKTLAKLAAKLEGEKAIGVHLVAEGDDVLRLKLIGAAFSIAGGSWYLPIRHEGDLGTVNADLEEAKALLAQIVAADDRELRVFDAKESLHALANEGVAVASRLVDVGLMAFADSGGDGISPAAVARRRLDYQVADMRDLIGGRDKPKRFALLGTEAAAKAAAGWARVAFDAREPLCEAMGNAKLRMFRQVEAPATAPLMAMERNGVLIDTAALAKLDAELLASMEEQAAEIRGIAGDEDFNPGSPKQLAELLYVKLNLNAGRKTKQGSHSTNEAELERLARTSESPLPQLVLAWRHAAKLSGTYTSALPKRINPKTGRVHTRFIQSGAITGRLASKDPNLQNIPIRSEEGRRIRRCFIADKNHLLVAADYSQIELRILAHFSGEEALLASFAAGEDVHSRTAAELYGISADKVSPEQRRFAKTINFGLIYGMGPQGLAVRLQIPHREAKEIITTYFKRLPKVSAYLESLKEQASDTGKISTLFGREITFPSRGKGHAAASAAQRAATNAPMQGTAADIMKLALSVVNSELAVKFPQAKLLLQVHDELVLETPKSEAKELGSWLGEKMAGVTNALDVPLTVDVGMGANWDEAH